MALDKDSIFSVKDSDGFIAKALEVFHHQYHESTLYQEFCGYLKVNPQKVTSLEEIPFLPIEFFKSKKILTGNHAPEVTFTSSGTTGQKTSNHLVADVSLYEESFLKGFRHFYGPVTDYCILALLPSYMERQDSSLAYMVDVLIRETKNPQSGFYLNNHSDLKHQLETLGDNGKKILLIGVSFALLDLVETTPLPLKKTILMETGGMKGRRREMIRSELHHILKDAFGVAQVHSEYGMTELLSQAYSQGNGIFNCPPWMKILVRDIEDPFRFQENGKTGGINVIDLANVNSCSFIATQDLGKAYPNSSFEVLGRFDHADIRGCNLMAI